MMYFKLYIGFLKVSLQKLMEYKADFIVGILSLLFEQLIGVAFLFIIYLNVPTLNGWTLEEMLLIYSIAMTGRSIDVTFFDNYWVFGRQFIITGNFETLLTKPINPLFQLTALRIQLQGIGQFIIGAILIVYTFTLLNIELSFFDIVMIPVFVISSGLIFAGINLTLTTLSFWIYDSLPLLISTFTISMIGRYPLTIFPVPVVIFTTFILPYGFTGFYPASFYFSGDHYTTLSIFTPLVAIIVWFVAIKFWNYGISKFVGTGS